MTHEAIQSGIEVRVMKIFEVERNDLCPCGSGRKYKKCCQRRVEDAVRRIGRVVELEDCTAEGRKIVETLGFICGIQAGEESHMPAPEVLGRLLLEAWDEEDRLRQEGSEVGLRSLWERFQKLLGEKPYLRRLRLPVWRFEDEDDFGILEYLNSPKGYGFLRESIALIYGSLHYDEYSEDELKILLTALGWLAVDRQQKIFWSSVISRTRDDLESAASEMDEIFGRESWDNDQERLYEEIEAVFERYPIFKKMLAENLAEDIRPAVMAILSGKIKPKVPLFSVLGGLYAVLYGFSESFESLIARKEGLSGTLLESELEDVLLDAGEYSFFITELVKSLVEAVKGLPEGELEVSLKKLISYFLIAFDYRYALLEYLYFRSILSFLAGLPLALPEAGVEFKKPEDFFDENLIEKYAAYLESRNLAKEAEHVRNVYRSFGVRASERNSESLKALLEFAAAFLSVDNHLCSWAGVETGNDESAG